MKRVRWLGDTLRRIGELPDDARVDMGRELRRVQAGLEPVDWKPMAAVGPGVREVRVRVASGAFRSIYLATLPDEVLVLHVFQKKTQATPQRDIELAARRLGEWRAQNG